MTLANAVKLRIIELCNEKNLSINKLCTLAGINHSTLASFFSGKTEIPKMNTIYYITIGFGISLGEFYMSPLFDNLDDD